MSGMSGMLHIALYRDAPSHHEPKLKKGTAARDATVTNGLLCLRWQRLIDREGRQGREESSAAWRDAKHAAHASDPWVLDGCPPT
jgi:hypothetical protein